jgi:hypothetical protein
MKRTFLSVFNRLKTAFRHREVRIQIVTRDPLRLTMEEWRSQPDLVKLAKGVIVQPEVRQMLDVLRTSHLATYTGVGTLEQRALHLSRCEGYNLALANFEALAMFEKPKEELEATFEPQEE